MLADFLIPFITVGVAEFLDKSQLAIVLLATRTKHHTHLLLGIMLAFVIVDGFAVVAGATIATVVPEQAIKLISAAAFLLFGFLLLRNKHVTLHEGRRKSAFISGFTLVFLSEWGDKTQIASAIFAANYHPGLVFAGIILALFFLTVLALYLGSTLVKKFDKNKIGKIAGLLFIALGIVIFFT